MTKKGQGKPKREITKRQLSLWQRQKRRQRLILSLGIFIIAAVTITVGAGWYFTQYRPLHETVITVNDTSFNMNYYINTLKLFGQEQPSYYIYYWADEAVRIIEENELIRQGAMKPEIGITISDDEVDEELKNSDLPISREYRDLVRAEMLKTKLQDEYFEYQVPAFAEQVHIMAILLESKSQALEVRARLENGESFAELAEELSLNIFTKTNEGDLDWHPKSILTNLLGSSTPAEFAFGSEAGALSQPLYDEGTTKEIGYWLIKVLSRDEEAEAAYIHAMLLSSEEEAQEVIARLEAGKDFATLAKEFSQYQNEAGGDLGMVTKGGMPAAFEDFAFNPDIELETLSEPIRDDTVVTTGGYWLVKLLDKDDNRKIEDDDRAMLKAEALNEWVSSLWDDPENKIESYLDEDKKSWAISKVMGELGQ